MSLAIVSPTLANGNGLDIGKGAEAGAPAPAPPLPCLYSINCNKKGQVIETNPLSPYHKKVAHAIYMNVTALCQKYGFGRIGFLTLTFAEDVEWREGQRRFHSLATGFLAEEFLDYICVVEFQKSGRIHYHLLVACREDIRAGLDFDQVAQQNYSTANPFLRNQWAKLREVLTRYGFGRHELLPIRKSEEAMARYIGKYISKGIPNRKPEHRGVRFVRYSRGFRVCSSRFAWNTPRAYLWRHKVAILAEKFGITTMEEATKQWGQRWAYKYATLIQSIKLTEWPSALHAVADGFLTLEDIREISRRYFDGGDAVAGMGEISCGVTESNGNWPPEQFLSVEAVADLIALNSQTKGHRGGHGRY